MLNPRGGPAPGGAPKRGGLGCQRGRQAEIDDRERYRQGAALSCCVTSRSLCGGGPVRAGAAFGRRAASGWNRKEGQLRSGLCGPRGPARPARLRGFRCAGSRPKTRGSFGQSESGSASLSRALDSELEALHGCTQISDATDLNQAPAANFSSAGGSTLGVVPKRCCLSRAHLIMGPSALEVCGCNYVAAE